MNAITHNSTTATEGAVNLTTQLRITEEVMLAFINATKCTK
jgi:hypothetical protein